MLIRRGLIAKTRIKDMNSIAESYPRNTQISAFDAINQFREAILDAGFSPPEDIKPDGNLHRFSTNGKRKDASGWYVLHLDNVPAGAFGCWRAGMMQNWIADIGRSLTPHEKKAHRAKLDRIREEREAEEVKRRMIATEKARQMWGRSKPAPADHPYLVKKRIKPHGVKIYRGSLLIPVRSGGMISSLQFIRKDGSKIFLSGGKMRGGYSTIGDFGENIECICIAEGFATAASIHEATGHPVVIAFNAGNLKPVAEAIRAKHPGLPLIVCADDDFATEGNPGMAKAREAARAVDGVVVFPDFGPDRPEKATDFNDLHQTRGLEAVKKCVELSVTKKTDVTDVTDVTASNDEASERHVTKKADVTDVTIPGLSDRPCFRVLDDFTPGEKGRKYKPGVWFFSFKETKDGIEPTATWVCSPVHIEAITYDPQENNFGRLLRVKNPLGRWREWAMPMEMLRGSGEELRGELLAMGVMIDPKQRNLLANYLQAKLPKRRVRCALQVGWCDGAFVLPDEAIGKNGSGVIFQSSERGHDEYSKAGSLQSWQTEIAAYAVGNPLMMLALSAAFAGPILAKCNAEGGGVHYVGDSSTGKTTFLEAACSVWGGPSYRRSWRATANGMEGAAAMFNDCLLALDEISECDPREVGLIVYSLGNGRGKQRASRSGSARSVTRWRCFILSSGERTIGTTMADGGHRTKAGQQVRLLDVPASRRFGCFDELHGFQSGAALADSIKREATTSHGYAGRAYLEKLTRDDGDFCAALEKIKSRPEFSDDIHEGQDKRASARFALIALAGELATNYGVTGWPQGQAIQAAAEGFRLWRSTRGRGNNERRQILERVSEFIDRHGDSRFSDANSVESLLVRDRCIFRPNVTDHFVST
ncbi:MAG: DUF927 domain-containing protein [Methylohalobius crimeensis]